MTFELPPRFGGEPAEPGPDSTERPSGEGSASFRVAGGEPIELLTTGLRWPGRRRRSVYLAYRDLLHISATSRGLRVATTRGIYSVSRRRLGDPQAQLLLLAALRRRIAALPEGEARLARMERLDRWFAEARPPRLTHALLVLCAALFGLQLWSDAVTQAGALRPGLIGLEPWRAVTGQFLHAPFEDIPAFLSPHLIFNGIGLWALGGFIERQLRPARTVLVLAAAGFGAAWFSVLAAYPWVIGASGLVMGLAGALLVMEFLRPERVPAPWRLPRALLVAVIAGDLLLTGGLPGVAVAAHLGGMLFGALATAWVTRSGPVGTPASLPIRGLAMASVAASALCFVALGWAVLAPEQATQRRANLLLETQEISPILLNDQAWTIAISERPSSDLLRLAERLAGRAVDATERRNPDLLDTLAEVLFQLGDEFEAVGLIEEAILLSPREPYFREQRRRFLGERDRDDRPLPPGSNPRLDPEEKLEPPRDGDALLV